MSYRLFSWNLHCWTMIPRVLWRIWNLIDFQNASAQVTCDFHEFFIKQKKKKTKGKNKVKEKSFFSWKKRKREKKKKGKKILIRKKQMYISRSILLLFKEAWWAEHHVKFIYRLKQILESKIIESKILVKKVGNVVNDKEKLSRSYLENKYHCLRTGMQISNFFVSFNDTIPIQRISWLWKNSLI